jgi:hypothetical protein
MLRPSLSDPLYINIEREKMKEQITTWVITTAFDQYSEEYQVTRRKIKYKVIPRAARPDLCTNNLAEGGNE